MKQIRFGIFIVFSLHILSGCTTRYDSKTVLENNTNQVKPTEKHNKIIKPVRESNRIEKIKDTLTFTLLKTLYQGDYNDSAKWIYRAKDKVLSDSFNDQANNFEAFVTSISKIDTIITGIDTNIFIISATVPCENGEPFSAHVTSPLLEAIIAKKTNSHQLKITLRGLLCMAGSFGEAPETEVRQIGKDHWGIILYPGFTGQGYTVNGMTVFTSINDRFIKVFETESIHSDNSGALLNDSLSHYLYDSKINYEASHNGDFYDLVIHTQGTFFNEKTNKVEPVDERKLYRFKGQKYVAIK